MGVAYRVKGVEADRIRDFGRRNTGAECGEPDQGLGCGGYARFEIRRGGLVC